MAVKLEKTTDQKKVLKLISVKDSAIDWDASYEDISDLDESEEQENDSELPEVTEQTTLSLEEQKKAHYVKHHDATKLKFKPDDEPTFFVFGHPHRADVARKMREIASSMYGNTAKKDKGGRGDMFTSVFDHFYLGMEEGFGGERVSAQRINGRLTDIAIQELEDAEIFIELNSGFMSVYNEDRTKGKKDKLEK